MPAFYGAVDLVKNELRNAVIQNLGSAPVSPLKGQLYFDTSTNNLYWWDGTTWQLAKAGAGTAGSTTVTTLAIGGAAVPGSSGQYSQGDHAHGMPAFGTPPTENVFGQIASAGSATTVARSDHGHGNPTLTTNPPTNQAIGDTAVVGSQNNASHEDHKHGMPAWASAVDIAQGTTFGQGASVGSSAHVPHGDHGHGTPPLPAVNALATTAGVLNMQSFQINALADPTNAQDAATKNYVDNSIAGLSWKEAARAATTANITLSATQTVDGIALSVGDRVLVKNQTTASANGLYLVAAAAWTRTTDAATAVELNGMAVFIEQGTTNATTAWVLSTPPPITVGTTSLTYAQFGAGSTYTAGNGLTLAGNVFAVGQGTGILSTPGQVAVDTTVIATQAYVTTAVTGMTKKYAVALNGSTSPETITHNLNTQDILVMVHNTASPYQFVQVDWAAPTVNTAQITYNPALGAGWRAVVVG